MAVAEVEPGLEGLLSEIKAKTQEQEKIALQLGEINGVTYGMIDQAIPENKALVDDLKSKFRSFLGAEGMNTTGDHFTMDLRHKISESVSEEDSHNPDKMQARLDDLNRVVRAFGKFVEYAKPKIDQWKAKNGNGVTSEKNGVMPTSSELTGSIKQADTGKRTDEPGTTSDLPTVPGQPEETPAEAQEKTEQEKTPAEAAKENLHRLGEFVVKKNEELRALLDKAPNRAALLEKINHAVYDSEQPEGAIATPVTNIEDETQQFYSHIEYSYNDLNASLEKVENKDADEISSLADQAEILAQNLMIALKVARGGNMGETTPVTATTPIRPMDEVTESVEELRGAGISIREVITPEVQQTIAETANLDDIQIELLGPARHFDVMDARDKAVLAIHERLKQEREDKYSGKTELEHLGPATEGQGMVRHAKEYMPHTDGVTPGEEMQPFKPKTPDDGKPKPPEPPKPPEDKEPKKPEPNRPETAQELELIDKYRADLIGILERSEKKKLVQQAKQRGGIWGAVKGFFGIGKSVEQKVSDEGEFTIGNNPEIMRIVEDYARFLVTKNCRDQATHESVRLMQEAGFRLENGILIPPDQHTTGSGILKALTSPGGSFVGGGIIGFAARSGLATVIGGALGAVGGGALAGAFSGWMRGRREASETLYSSKAWLNEVRLGMSSGSSAEMEKACHKVERLIYDHSERVKFIETFSMMDYVKLANLYEDGLRKLSMIEMARKIGAEKGEVSDAQLAKIYAQFMRERSADERKFMEEHGDVFNAGILREAGILGQDGRALTAEQQRVRSEVVLDTEKDFTAKETHRRKIVRDAVIRGALIGGIAGGVGFVVGHYIGNYIAGHHGIGGGGVGHAGGGVAGAHGAEGQVGYFDNANTMVQQNFHPGHEFNALLSDPRCPTSFIDGQFYPGTDQGAALAEAVKTFGDRGLLNFHGMDPNHVAALMNFAGSHGNALPVDVGAKYAVHAGGLQNLIDGVFNGGNINESAVFSANEILAKGAMGAAGGAASRIPGWLLIAGGVIGFGGAVRAGRMTDEGAYARADAGAVRGDYFTNYLDRSLQTGPFVGGEAPTPKAPDSGTTPPKTPEGPKNPDTGTEKLKADLEALKSRQKELEGKVAELTKRVQDNLTVIVSAEAVAQITTDAEKIDTMSEEGRLNIISAQIFRIIQKKDLKIKDVEDNSDSYLNWAKQQAKDLLAKIEAETELRKIKDEIDKKEKAAEPEPQTGNWEGVWSETNRPEGYQGTDALWRRVDAEGIDISLESILGANYDRYEDLRDKAQPRDPDGKFGVFAGGLTAAEVAELLTFNKQIIEALNKAIAEHDKGTKERGERGGRKHEGEIGALKNRLKEEKNIDFFSSEFLGEEDGADYKVLSTKSSKKMSPEETERLEGYIQKIISELNRLLEDNEPPVPPTGEVKLDLTDEEQNELNQLHQWHHAFNVKRRKEPLTPEQEERRNFLIAKAKDYLDYKQGLYEQRSAEEPAKVEEKKRGPRREKSSDEKRRGESYREEGAEARRRDAAAREAGETTPASTAESEFEAPAEFVDLFKDGLENKEQPVELRLYKEYADIGNTALRVAEKQGKSPEEVFGSDFGYFESLFDAIQESQNDVHEGIKEKVSPAIIKLFNETTDKIATRLSEMGETVSEASAEASEEAEPQSKELKAFEHALEVSRRANMEAVRLGKTTEELFGPNFDSFIGLRLAVEEGLDDMDKGLRKNIAHEIIELLNTTTERIEQRLTETEAETKETEAGPEPEPGTVLSSANPFVEGLRGLTQEERAGRAARERMAGKGLPWTSKTDELDEEPPAEWETELESTTQVPQAKPAAAPAGEPVAEAAPVEPPATAKTPETTTEDVVSLMPEGRSFADPNLRNARERARLLTEIDGAWADKTNPLFVRTKEFTNDNDEIIPAGEYKVISVTGKADTSKATAKIAIETSEGRKTIPSKALENIEAIYTKK